MVRYRANDLARNTGWMLFSQGLCLFIQAAYFVIIARSLGVQQYGAFIAAVAFTQILSPFVGFGGGNLLVKYVCRDKAHFPVYWGNLLFMTLASGLAAIALVVAAAKLALPPSIPLAVIVSVSFAELLFSRLTDCAGMAFQSIEQLSVTAQLNIWSAGSRLIGIGTLAAVLKHPAARHWAFVYLLTTIFSAALGLAWVRTKLGRPRLALRGTKADFIEGLYFSVSISAQSIYNDIDKTMLGRLATLDATGIYAVAYRLTDVAFIPVRSLLSAAYPGFFRTGQKGVKESLRYMRPLLSKSACYSVFASVCLVIFAPVVSRVFGSRYAGTVEALRWLAPLPFLRTVHYFFADSLTGAGYQRLRTILQVCVAAGNILVNFWLIPVYSWRGAAWSSLASDGLLAVSLCCCAALLRNESVNHTNRPPLPVPCQSNSR